AGWGERCTGWTSPAGTADHPPDRAEVPGHQSPKRAGCTAQPRIQGWSRGVEVIEEAQDRLGAAEGRHAPLRIALSPPRRDGLVGGGDNGLGGPSRPRSAQI